MLRPSDVAHCLSRISIVLPRLSQWTLSQVLKRKLACLEWNHLLSMHLWLCVFFLVSILFHSCSTNSTIAITRIFLLHSWCGSTHSRGALYYPVIKHNHYW